MMDPKIEMRYFSSVEGKTVTRFADPYDPNAYIGAERTDKGMVFHTDQVVAIPVVEIKKYWRQYRRLLNKNQRGGAALTEKKESDFKAWAKKQAAASKKAAKVVVAKSENEDK